MQVNTPKPVDGCQDRSAPPTTRPAALDSVVRARPPSQPYPSALHASLFAFSEVCEHVSNTPDHPLSLSKPAYSTRSHVQLGESLMALPLADLARRAADPNLVTWSSFTAEQSFKSSGSLSRIPPSSPISPPVVVHQPPVSACFGPQLLGAAASIGSVPTPAIAAVPGGAPDAADALVIPTPPPRRRPRRRTDGAVGKAAKPRNKTRGSGRKGSSVGSDTNVSVSPLLSTEETGRRKPAGAAGTPTHTCKVPGCNRAFARTYNLSTHMRTHTGDCPYACDDKSCAKKFKWKSSLTSHRKFHEKREAEARAAEAASAAAAAAAALASAAAEAEMSTAESTESEAVVAGVVTAVAPRSGGVVPLTPVGVVQVMGARVGDAETAASALAKLRLEGSLGRTSSV